MSIVLEIIIMMIIIITTMVLEIIIMIIIIMTMVLEIIIIRKICIALNPARLAQSISQFKTRTNSTIKT